MWKRINEIVEMWDEPCLGTVKAQEGRRFMALCIDPLPTNGKYKGIARQISEREGDVSVVGFVDRSKLVLIESGDLLSWEIVDDLTIKGIENIINKFETEEVFFIGLEDPDIVVDKKNIKHVYFTIAYKYKDKEGHKLYLGHAMGDKLENLEATDPVIEDNKEVAFCPASKDRDHRQILAESWSGSPEEGISLLKAEEMSKTWELEKLVYKADEDSPEWRKGYASPCRIIHIPFMKNTDKLLGICTGNSGIHTSNGKKLRGDFEPGLFIFNTATENIEWIDKNSLFKDPDAETITFASEFIPLDDIQGLLYCHIDDSFVRAYRVNYEEIRKRLSKGLVS